jgi:hypothetical protein
MRKSGQALETCADWISVGVLASSGAAVELSFPIERE